MTKNMLSILLAVVMLLTMLAACNKEPVEDVENPDNQQEENQGGEEVVLPETLDLVVDGTSDYVIVRGENAYISEITASTELQSYIKQITGVELPIVTDSAEPVEKEIIVGKTNRESDGEFKTNGAKLYLVGGEQRGTLYSVYEFLEAYLGCRFYTSKFEKIPALKTISLEEIKEDKQIPVFETRTVHWADYSQNDYFSSKRKTIVCKWGKASEAYGGNPTWINIGGDVVHSLGTLAETGREGQPCLTDENIYNTILKNVKAYLVANPDADIISVAQNDNDDYCECDNCKAKVAEYGTMGGLNIWFTNRIADAIKTEFPDVLVHTFAYRYTRHVPTNIKPADNVIVELCSIEACFRHPLSECTEYSGENFADLIKGWGEICDNLYIWDYTTNYRNYLMTFPNFEVLRDNLKLFADCGVAHVLEQGNYSAVESGEFGELRCYLLSHLLWDPYMSDEELYELKIEFMQDFYGPGWESILQYLNLAHDLTADTCFDIYSDAEEVFPWPKAVQINEAGTYPEELTIDMVRNYETTDWSKYWNWYKGYTEVPQIITEGERLFAEALAAAETDMQKAMIDRSSIQIEFLKSYYVGTNLEYGESGIGKLVGNFMLDHPEEFSDDEIGPYRRNIIKFAREQAYATYAEQNKALVDHMLSYGIYYAREGRWLGDFNAIDFTQIPNDWIG